MHTHGPVWYAAYTNSRAEKKVARELDKIGIEHYLPLRQTLRQWSDRKKRVWVPLITSYVFVRIMRREHRIVLEVPGVVKILHFGGKPVPIPDWQIRNLQILLGSHVHMNMGHYNFEKGVEVQINQGTLQGLRGKIVRIRGRNKLVISIYALDYNLTIDIDPAFVEPIKK